MNAPLKASIEEASPVELAWTAGWDSTFRLLQLLLVEGRAVRPHYIVRPESSAGQEINAMNQIRRTMFRDQPEVRGLLKPTEFIDVRAISKDRGLEVEYKRVTRTSKINYQYLLIASYCRQQQIAEMELGILEDETLGSANETLFRELRLPLKGLSKLDMKDYSKAHGFSHLMDMTVFCRRPRSGRPCGICGPCHDVISMGMGYRLPLMARLRASVQAPFRRWWRANYSEMNPGLKSTVSRVLKGRY